MIEKVRMRLWQARDSWRANRIEARARRLARRPAPDGHALLFTAAGVGSLGDEAMITAAGHEFRRRGVAHLTLVSYGPGAPWPAIEPFDDVLDFDRRYARDFWSTCEEWLDACVEATHVMILGADVMDGHYNPNECVRRCVYARIAAGAGLWTTIAGFSFNDHPHRWCVASLKALPPAVHVVARDPLSRQRLEAAIGRPVIGGADLAFLLAPTTASPLLETWRPWFAAERAAGRLLVGVNANLLVTSDGGGDRTGEALAGYYADGLAEFHAEHGPLSLALLPHDARKMQGRVDDLSLLEAIAARLPEDLAAHTRILTETASAAELKALAGAVDLVVSGRMHLAIGALGMGVPAGGVVYQGKFEGLYQHFDLSGLCLAPDALASGGRLAPFLAGLSDRRADLGHAIAARLAEVQALALHNFDDFPLQPAKEL